MEPLSKGEDGHRIIRKVNIDGENLEIISSDISKLDPKEKTLLQAYLEDGSKEYQDKDFWVRTPSGGKRKVKEEILVTGKEPRSKRQKLITSSHNQENKNKEVLVLQQEKHKLEIEAKTINEENEAVQNLRDRMLAKLMIKKGPRPWKGS